jgi:hypothetical protein
VNPLLNDFGKTKAVLFEESRNGCAIRAEPLSGIFLYNSRLCAIGLSVCAHRLNSF